MFIAPHGYNNPLYYTDNSGHRPIDEQCGFQGEACGDKNPIHLIIPIGGFFAGNWDPTLGQQADESYGDSSSTTSPRVPVLNHPFSLDSPPILDPQPLKKTDSQYNVYAYLGYDEYPDASISVTDISIINESDRFVAVRGVEFNSEVRYPGFGASDQNYFPNPPRWVDNNLNNTSYLFWADPGHSSKFNLIPSGYSANPNNYFSNEVKTIFVAVFFRVSMPEMPYVKLTRQLR